jgi:hypothetical protein
LEAKHAFRAFARKRRTCAGRGAHCPRRIMKSCRWLSEKEFSGGGTRTGT